MSDADIESEVNFDAEDFVDEPLVAQKKNSRQIQRRSRYKNKFKAKRRFAQCLMTIGLVLLVLGIVITLVYAIKTSEFNDNNEFEENDINNDKKNSYFNRHFEDSKEYLPENDLNPRHILVWSDNRYKWNFPSKKFLAKDLGCPKYLYSCHIEVSHLITDQLTYDAIVFDGDTLLTSQPASYKSTLLVFASKSTPPSSIGVKLLKDHFKFGLTLTYRSDADINWSMIDVRMLNGSHIAPAKNPQWKYFSTSYKALDTDIDQLLKLVESRTNFAMIRICDNGTLGAQIFDELKNYILPTVIDIDKTCKGSYEDLSLGKYKFIFAFEDVLCTDQISDFFYMALKEKVIPVVIGGPTTYDNFAPPHSYIRADNFTSIRELAEFLIHLDENPTEYIDYLWWTHYFTIKNAYSPFCKLCEILHETSLEESIEKYYVQKDWWDHNQCIENIGLLSS